MQQPPTTVNPEQGRRRPDIPLLQSTPVPFSATSVPDSSPSVPSTPYFSASADIEHIEHRLGPITVQGSLTPQRILEKTATLSIAERQNYIDNFASSPDATGRYLRSCLRKQQDKAKEEEEERKARRREARLLEKNRIRNQPRVTRKHPLGERETGTKRKHIEPVSTVIDFDVGSHSATDEESAEDDPTSGNVTYCSPSGFVKDSDFTGDNLSTQTLLNTSLPLFREFTTTVEQQFSAKSTNMADSMEKEKKALADMRAATEEARQALAVITLEEKNKQADIQRQEREHRIKMDTALQIKEEKLKKLEDDRLRRIKEHVDKDRLRAEEAALAYTAMQTKRNALQQELDDLEVQTFTAVQSSPSDIALSTTFDKLPPKEQVRVMTKKLQDLDQVREAKALGLNEGKEHELASQINDLKAKQHIRQLQLTNLQNTYQEAEDWPENVAIVLKKLQEDGNKDEKDIEALTQTRENIESVRQVYKNQVKMPEDSKIPLQKEVHHKNLQHLQDSFKPGSTFDFSTAWERLVDFGSPLKYGHREYKIALGMLLQGDPYNSYRAMKMEPLPDIIDALCEAYGAHNTLERDLEAIRRFQRKTGESLKAAIGRLKILLKKTEPIVPISDKIGRMNSTIDSAIKTSCSPAALKEIRKTEMETRTAGVILSPAKMLELADRIERAESFNFVQHATQVRDNPVVQEFKSSRKSNNGAEKNVRGQQLSTDLPQFSPRPRFGADTSRITQAQSSPQHQSGAERGRRREAKLPEPYVPSPANRLPRRRVSFPDGPLHMHPRVQFDTGPRPPTATSPGRNSGNPNWRNRSPARQDQAWRPSSSAPSNEPYSSKFCVYCKRSGHFARTCFKLRNDEACLAMDFR